jgi:hypothetical protein
MGSFLGSWLIVQGRQEFCILKILILIDQNNRAIGAIQEGKSWRTVFPNVATLRVEADPVGYGVSLRITKQQGESVHLVPEGKPWEAVAGCKLSVQYAASLLAGQAVFTRLITK